MDINEIWLIIEPYIAGVAAAGASGGIIYFVIKQLIGKWFRANDLNTLTVKFAESVVGKTINIDFSALVEARLAEVEASLVKAIEERLGENEALSRSLSLILADIGEVYSRSKMLTEEERTQLVNDVEAVKSAQGIAPIPIRSQPISVKLEPIRTAPHGMISFD